MALIKCRYCGKEISDRASDCIHCGTPIDKNPAELFAEMKLREKELAFQNEMSKAQEEKRILEQQNTEYKNQANLLAHEQNERVRLASENSVLAQRNEKLESEVVGAKKSVASLKKVADELAGEKTSLEKQLAEANKAVDTLEKKIERSKKLKNANKQAGQIWKRLLNVLRLALMWFFAFGALVGLTGGKISLAIWYLSMAIAVSPYLYRQIWKRIDLPTSTKMAIEIIVPIVVLFLL